VTRARHSPILVVLVLALASGTLADDVLRLRNGAEIRGRIVEETDDAVTVDLRIGGRMTVARSQIEEIRRGAGEPAKPAEPGGKMEREGTFLVLGPGAKLEGWRITRTYRRDDDRLFESETGFLAEGEQPAVRIHLVEVAGPDLSAKAFTYREKVGERKEFLRHGEIDGEELRITEIRDGVSKGRTVPFPAGTWLPAAARAFVLGKRADLDGEKGLDTPVFDPVTGAFATIRWTAGGSETVEDSGGKPVEVAVLRAERAGVASEERLATDGRTVSAELNGPSLRAVAVPADRVERLRKDGATPEGEASPEAGAEAPGDKHVDLEAGFSIRKPGSDWTFEAGSGYRRVTLRNLDLFAYVDVLRDTSIPRGTKLETLALNLQQRLAVDSEEFTKDADGFTKLGGERAYFLTARSRLKGEEVRSLVVACLHGDVAWIVIAACPVDYFEKGKPVFERIAASFAFL
jgi:hypothetical protein